jgi:hypothetical protein
LSKRAEVLVGTESGCRVFCEGAESELELPNRCVGPLALDPNGSCIAIVDQREIWRRSTSGAWTKLAAATIPVQSLLVHNDQVFLGGMDEPTLLGMTGEGDIVTVTKFEDVPGRKEWFAGGPPLGVRSLTAVREGQVLITAVHVGGMPRSQDGGKTWVPTIPIMFDVHEVRSHPSLPNFAAAATAAGLCVSLDGGEHWNLIAEGLDITNSLALAVLEDDVLFSIQDGPFPKRSQIWRWPVNGGRLQPVQDGLPEWLEGKVDTAEMASGHGQAALCDGGGNLWLSEEQASGWHRIAEGLGYAYGVLIA